MIAKLTSIFKTKLFWSILLVKIIASFIFASQFPVQYFIPFAKYFALQPFDNPYSYFVSQNFMDAFPYPPLMLLILAFPFTLLNFLFNSSMHTIFVDLFLLRIPLILADIGVLLILCKLLSNKRKEAMYYYWCSPILFYITYVHGQLDVIPMFFLLISLALLFIRDKFAKVLSFVIFGAGLSVKTHLILALPFLLIYEWKQKRSFIYVASMALISAGIFALFTLPFLSEGFVKMVFLSAQQNKFFAFTLPLYEKLFLFIAPIAYLLLFLRFSGYKRFNPDMLMMILSLVFSIFMVLAPPRIGWFFWGVPFMIYFFVKLDNLRKFTYWLLNAAYFLFFFTSKEGDGINLLQPLIPSFASAQNIYHSLYDFGLNADLLSSMMFSLLASSILIIAYWIYKYGISANEEYFVQNKPITIGIGGDSGAGKTTLSELLIKTFGIKNTLVVNGDDMHRWERYDEHWKSQTHLNPNSNRLHLDYYQAIQLIKGKPVQRSFYDHTTGIFTNPVDITPTKFLLFVGLHPFYIKGMREMQDIRIFVEPQEELRQHWKITRDVAERGYTKEKALNFVKQRKQDSNKYILPQRDFAHISISFMTKEKFKIGADNIGAGKMLLRVRMENSVDAEKIEAVLSNIKTLFIKQNYEQDCEHQTLDFSGTITKDQIKKAVRLLILKYRSIVEYEPLWQENYEGLIQLIILFYIGELAKSIGPKYE